MSWSPTSAFKILVGLAGWIGGLGVFGRLRYYWVQHAVDWRPEPRYGQYLIPALAVLILLLLMRRRTRTAGMPHERPADPSSWGALPNSIGPVWGAGFVGGLLALCQAWFEPRGPWLLYAWMALLVFGVCRLIDPLRLPSISSRGCRLWIMTATAGMIVLHVSLQLDLWRSLSFGYRDIGLFARALHNAAAGRGLWVDSIDRSILGEHAFFALWALVPLCKLGADPFGLLVILSALCLNGPALLVSGYVRRRMNSDPAALIAGLAWLLIPAHGCLAIAQGYGFHAVYLAPPVLFAGLALGGLGRWRSAAACMLLCLLIREDLALTVGAWGMVVFLSGRRRLLGAGVGIVAIAYLILAVTIIVPHYRGESYPHIAFHFNRIVEGRSIGSVILTNLSFLLTLILPLAGLPLRRGRWACVALPVLIEAMLISNVELHNICFQYAAPAVVILFFAALEAGFRVARAGSRSSAAMVDDPIPGNTAREPEQSRKTQVSRFGICLLAAALAGHLYLGVGPLSNNPARPSSHPILRAEIDRIDRIRSGLPDDARVTASYRIAAHFLDVDRLWMVGDERLGDVVIIHDADHMDGSDPRGALARALRTGGYQPAFANYHLVMLVRDDQPTALAGELRPDRLPEGVAPVSIELGSGLELVGIGRRLIGGSGQSARRVRLTLVWRCTVPVERDYRFGLTLGAGDSRWGPFYFARGAYPTSVWEPGRLYLDALELRVRETDWGRLRELEAVLLE